MGAIIGGGAAILLIIGAVIAFVVIRKRRNNAYSGYPNSYPPTSTTSNDANEEGRPIEVLPMSVIHNNKMNNLAANSGNDLY